MPHYTLSILKTKIITLLTHIPTKHLDMFLLIAHVCHINRIQYINDTDMEISRQNFEEILAYAQKRASGIPLAYIIGTKEFYGHSFIVNQSVLIPRPETELVIETALRYIKKIENDERFSKIPKTLLDCGTGSGCIGISLAKELQNNANTLNSEWAITLSDICPHALKVARENMARILFSADKDTALDSVSTPSTTITKSYTHRSQYNITCEERNLLEIRSCNSNDSSNGNNRHSKASHSNEIIKDKKFGIIIANLPYVAPYYIKMTNIKHEPALALDGNIDGNIEPFIKSENRYCHSQSDRQAIQNIPTAQKTNSKIKKTIRESMPRYISDSPAHLDGTGILELLFMQSKKLTHPHILILEADPLQNDRIRTLAYNAGYTHFELVCDLKKYPRVFVCTCA